MKWSLLLLSIVILINAGGPASVNFKTDTKKIIMAEAEARPRLDTFMDRPRVAPGRTNFNRTLLSRNSDKFSFSFIFMIYGDS